MGKKKRGNYNQDHFKLGGSMQPGGDVLQEREKRRLTKKPSDVSRQPSGAKGQPPASQDKNTAES